MNDLQKQKNNGFKMNENNDLLIEAKHEDLVALKEELYKSIEDVDLLEETELRAGQHGEPLLIALIIALGGATLTKEVFKTIRHWMDNRKQTDKLDVIKLYLKSPDGMKDITLEELINNID